MPIKILFTGMTSNPGGMETYMMNIFSKLEGHGFHFDFLNTDIHQIAYASYIKSRGGTIWQVPVVGPFRHFTRMNKAERFFIKHHNYDIVHMNTIYLNSIFWIKAAKKYGIKNLIIQSHNCSNTYNSLFFHILSSILDYYNKMYLKLHPSIKKFAASKACGQWMFGANSYFKVISNGIDVNVYSPNKKYRRFFKNKLGLAKNDKVIITTSRLESQKNYPKIINVFKWIHKYDQSVKLVIIGSGSQMQLVKSMVKRFNLNNSVYFLGQKSRNSIAKYLNVADLMLMPSLYEGMPFSLIEAQSTGVPAIVSNGIPKDANITGNVHFISLNKSNKYWANQSLDLLHESFTFNDRLNMNNKIRYSDYNIDNAVNNIKHIYSQMVK